MYITARTQMFSHQYGIKDTFQMIKENGFDGVEFSFEDKKFQPRYDMLDEYFLKYIAELADQYQVPIMSAGSHMNYVNSDEIFEYTKNAIQKTSLLNTDIFIITAVSTPDEHVNKTVKREKAIERIKVLAEIAEQSGIRLALEPEPGHVFQTTEEVMELFHLVKSNALCCNFDMGHSFLMDPDIYEAITLLDKKIIHCHVENMPRGRHLHLLPNEGDMDMAKVIRQLEDVQFNGAMALDIYQYEYEKVCGDAYQYLYSLLKK